MLAVTTGKEPEEVVNNAVYGYLAIADPLADDDEFEPSPDMREIMFCITETEAEEIEGRLNKQGLDNIDLDSYSKALLLKDLYTSSQETTE